MFVVYYPIKVCVYSELADPHLNLYMSCFNMTLPKMDSAGHRNA